MEQRTINISSVESTEKKINLLDGKLKYNFWRTKKDGSLTKAEEQFQQFRFLAGDTAEAMVEETPQTFTNEKGKEINFTDRKIAYFITQDNTPVAPRISPDAPQAPPQPFDPLSHTESTTFSPSILEDLENRVKKLEDWKDKQPVWADINGKPEAVPF